jgi:hypothetical protein
LTANPILCSPAHRHGLILDLLATLPFQLTSQYLLILKLIRLRQIRRPINAWLRLSRSVSRPKPICLTCSPRHSSNLSRDSAQSGLLDSWVLQYGSPFPTQH